MVWFRVDDGFAMSRKVLSIPKARRAAAAGVWLLAGTWSARELTDGFVPNFALDEMPSGKKAAPDLVSASLWREVSDGFQFNNWEQYQPSKEDVEKDRAGHAARQKAYRDRKQAERDASRVTKSVTSRHTPVTVPRPDPTRPDPTVLPTEVLGEVKKLMPPSPKSARGTRLPRDWKPSPELVSWVQSECPDVDGREQSDRFRDYWHAKAGRDAIKLDWDLTFKNWMRKARDEAGTRRNGFTKPAPVLYAARPGQMAREA
jgi:hypothetical protein